MPNAPTLRVPGPRRIAVLTAQSRAVLDDRLEAGRPDGAVTVQ